MRSTLTVTNNGTTPVYVGGVNVSQFNGVGVPPGTSLHMQSVTAATYAASPVALTGTNYTTSSSALSAGATVVTLAAAQTFATSGQYFVIGSGNALEVVQASTGFTGSSFTLSTATLYDHRASCTVSTATLVPGQLTFLAGVV